MFSATLKLGNDHQFLKDRDDAMLSRIQRSGEDDRFSATDSRAAVGPHGRRTEFE